MRLTCPNCDAQYEVPDEVIPAEGRDVQCSDCGHTWFQPAAGDAVKGAGDEEDFAPPLPDDLAAMDAPRQARARDDEFEEEEDDDDRDFSAVGTQSTMPEGRGIDSDISGILREEAEREARLRAREAEALESQPDLGLDAYPGDEPERRAREAHNRMARIRGEEPEIEEQVAGSRRGLLPDIEEINSTLRGSETKAGTPAPVTHERARKQRSGGFTRGLVVMLVFGAVLFLLYANAPHIARSVPQADPMLSAYVALVDQARLWLDAQVAALVPRP
ncbi:zinc-ribbon domain-containing protein [Ruegeria marina]|uniref:MJ0042 family finger-like domain-containing protein n=1 Tax=Ruegeria marina TaxID=639004 RepID=A0A1G6NHU6_9RHOB|nr:zinc-ribbon domain-containing protein [Ruegeria marina]SDC67482.1 MJ0042 family finger-like domain-containing protein [Ruegeria marina]